MYNLEVACSTKQVMNIEEKINYFKSASLSENTQAAYKYDLKHFENWGGKIPCSPEMVSAYLADTADDFNVRTTERRLRTIRATHKYGKFPDPTTDEDVIRTMKGIKNALGAPPRKAAPIVPGDLIKINDYFSSKTPKKLIHYRDNALMHIGFYGALRVSELLSIRFEHLKFTPNGVEILLPRSKTDQAGNGKVCAIPGFVTITCPVKLLLIWLEKAQITEGYVFRAFLTGRDIIGENHLMKTEFHGNLKRLIRNAEIGDPSDYSTHSLRRGFATSATNMGASLIDIMRHGRWVEPRTVMGYIDDAARFSKNPASLMDQINN